jgi:PII-like signaling protein
MRSQHRSNTYWISSNADKGVRGAVVLKSPAGFRLHQPQREAILPDTVKPASLAK